MARLLLLRHGQSTWNAEGRWQGWADPPLSEAGEAQSVAVAGLVAGAGIAAVVASDLRRAQRTAAVVADVLGVGPVEVDPALRERDVGAWSGLTGEEIATRWPDALAAWRAGRLDGPPGGESDADLAARVFCALDLLARRPEPVILVVTHGGVISLVERRLGVAHTRTANGAGRWLHGVGGRLEAGEALLLPDPGGQVAATST